MAAILNIKYSSQTFFSPAGGTMLSSGLLVTILDQIGRPLVFVIVLAGFTIVPNFCIFSYKQFRRRI
mgnify:CR=1 FL=1